MEDNEIKMVSLECLCTVDAILGCGIFYTEIGGEKNKTFRQTSDAVQHASADRAPPFFGSAHPPKNLHSDLKAVLVLGRGVVARLVAKVEPVDRERKSAAAKAIQ